MAKSNKNLTRTTLAERLALDPDKIEVQLCKHATYLYQAGVAKAKATANRNAIRDEYREVQAAVALELREQHAVAGTKITEAALKQHLDLAPAVITARRSSRTAESALEKADALYSAFTTRGHLLRDLAAIHNTESYQLPK